MIFLSDFNNRLRICFRLEKNASSLYDWFPYWNYWRLFICVQHEKLLMYVWGPWYDASSLDYRVPVAWHVRYQVSFFSNFLSTVFFVLLSHIWVKKNCRLRHLKWCSIFEYSRIVDVYHLNFTFIAISIKNWTSQTVFVHRWKK